MIMNSDFLTIIYIKPKQINLVKPIVKREILKSYADTFQKFQPLIFEKAETIQNAKNFAYINFGIEKCRFPDLKSANTLNRTLTKLYNFTNGKMKCPPTFEIYNPKHSKYCGYCSENSIECMADNFLETTIVHELGHYNHSLCSPNYKEMGKEKEIVADGGKTFVILENFLKNKSLQKAIRKELSSDAVASPAEFVACTLEKFYNGKKLSSEITEAYKIYDGPFAEVIIGSHKP